MSNISSFFCFGILGNKIFMPITLYWAVCSLELMERCSWKNLIKVLAWPRRHWSMFSSSKSFDILQRKKETWLSVTIWSVRLWKWFWNKFSGILCSLPCLGCVAASTSFSPNTSETSNQIFSTTWRPGSHCTRRGRRFDLSFQRKFQWAMSFWYKCYQKTYKLKKSVEGSSLRMLGF